MRNEHREFLDFVLDSADALPMPKRARIYRALAEHVGNDAERSALLAMAADLEAADQRCRNFPFSFRGGSR